VPEDIIGRQRRVPVGGITWRHTFRALRHRNYRLFFWGQLVSLIGTWMQQTAMSWYVYQITNSKFLLGAVSAVGSAPMMLSSIWGGALADLYPKRSILVATQAAQMICAFLLAAGVWLGFASTGFIIIVAALNGIAMGFDMPARQAFTVEMASREDLLNAISLNSSIVNGARVVGPSVAGMMIGAVGVAMCFFLNGLSFVAVIAGLLLMCLPPFERKIEITSAAEHAWEGIVYSMKHPRVRTILLLFLAVGVFGWSYAVLMPAFARDVLGRGANGYGILMSASGTGAFVGALLVATFGHLFHAAQNRTRRRLVVFRGDAGAFVREKFSARANIPLRRWVWNAAVFFNFQHCTANHCAGPNAGEGHGRVVARVRRYDSAWQPRSGSCCALGRHILRARVWRNHLRCVGVGDFGRDSAPRGATGEMICRGRRIAWHRHRQAERFPYNFSTCFTSTIRRGYQSAIHDVQGAFLDIERRFSDGFA
jgi:MFS family permease